MPINSFSVGRDISLTIVGPQGILNFPLITSFMSKVDLTDQKVKGLDGITRHVRFHDGWSGSFEVERQDSTADDYFAQLENAYYAGQNELAISITETISEVNGSISQYRYLQVLLRYEDAGTWKGDATIKQKIGFVAARRIKVS